MNTKNTDLALLPSGFSDLLPPDAEKEARAIEILMQRLASFGYRRIKPPIIEFEDSLLAPGPGEIMAPETFRLMDPSSHRMIGLRADITPQIARIASSRLINEPRPLRLAYASDVLRTRASQLRTRRQFCQVGCEIIGDGSIDTDVEICMLALIGLKDLGFDSITLDLNIPGLVKRLLEKENIPNESLQIIKKAIRQRDRDTLEKQENAACKHIAKVMDASGPASIALKKLKALTQELSKISIAEDIATLDKVYADLEKGIQELGHQNINITIDALDQEGFEYHKNLGFTLFSPQIAGELGRGGCYDVRFGTSDSLETARGFTLYMDTITCAGLEEETRNRIYVHATESWETITKLQAENWIVVRGSTQHNFPENCSHYYNNGTIEKTNG